MSRRFDSRGRVYDSSIPVYFIIDDQLAFDRLDSRVVKRSSLGNIGEPEIGKVTADWAKHNSFPGIESALQYAGEVPEPIQEESAAVELEPDLAEIDSDFEVDGDEEDDS